LENRPGTKILYVTSENFTNEVISSIRSGKQEQMAQLRDKYRTVDVLMIDDIQFIIGKDSTQEEFFHTFNELHQSGKQIILSSDRPPREMETLEERFRSRFSMGLVADVQVPDYETRMAILQKNDETRLADQKTNENNDAEINNAIFDYIAENVTTSIRDLEGAYNKVIAHARMNNIPYESFTLEDAQEALKDVITSDEHRIITIPLILTTVCNFYGINEEELLSRRRTSDVVMPRQVAMYLCRILTDESLDKIGESLGGKDHTTVINGINRIKSSVDTNSELSKAIEQIRKKLGA
ncbi:MAG: chromosomal replication initiator protein DnaA, partial [Butyrivibrio sp.]|nr:chromosomal replication initiator protein DnaA [Butyrivibrio sp.]